MPANLPRRLLAHSLAAAVLFVTCAACLWYFLALRQARLDVPFVYQDDGLLMQMLVQNGLEGRWYTWTDRLGAPFGQEMSDYPCADTLDFLVIKGLGLFSRDTATVFNVFYLLTYPLAAWAALIALRALGLSYPAAVAGGVLYAFIPYHYLRGEGHLFLTSYFVCPLVVPSMIWLTEGWVPLWRANESTGRLVFRPADTRLGWALVACMLLGAGNPYYGFYAMFLYGVAGVAALARRPSLAGLGGFVGGVLLAGVIAGSIVGNMLPSILYEREHGKNPVARKREPAEAEIFGLKIAQCLLPAPEHRIPQFRAITDSYYEVDAEPDDRYRPLNNENETAALGLVGAVGFLLLLVSVLAARRPGFPSTLAGLAELNLGAVLLATVGGLGAVINLWFPQMRAYNRISVFVSFFVIAAVLWVVDRLWHLGGGRRHWRALELVLLAGLVAFGVYDQMTFRAIPGPTHAETYAEVAARWAADAGFVSSVEAKLEPGAMVAQLPVVEFPESPSVHQLRPYRPLYGYLHSKTLRWSTAAIKGRPASELQATWEKPEHAWSVGRNTPPDELLALMRKAGFRALLVDWDGYVPANREGMRKELIARLGEPIAELPRPAEEGKEAEAAAKGPLASFFKL